ncbi:unnamed protein product [Protopolystoma xenopodis]|uniref:Uncharacterized protein n=1 Tax=Protopolystoma xenopodis TaxID=117903 RepID=A0A448WDH7_9PLAT|nr:unnamed protein product [Protopolystoma xenopodis]
MSVVLCVYVVSSESLVLLGLRQFPLDYLVKVCPVKICPVHPDMAVIHFLTVAPVYDGSEALSIVPLLPSADQTGNYFIQANLHENL